MNSHPADSWERVLCDERTAALYFVHEEGFLHFNAQEALNLDVLRDKTN